MTLTNTQSTTTATTPGAVVLPSPQTGTQTTTSQTQTQQTPAVNQQSSTTQQQQQVATQTQPAIIPAEQTDKMAPVMLWYAVAAIAYSLTFNKVLQDIQASPSGNNLFLSSSTSASVLPVGDLATGEAIAVENTESTREWADLIQDPVKKAKAEEVLDLDPPTETAP